MAEKLQSLLERIQKDGIEKAESEAEIIVAQAKVEAESIVKEAKAEGEKTLKKAEQESEQFAARGTRSLEQAARDVILSVQKAIDGSFQRLVDRKVGEALDADTLRRMLIKVVAAYCDDETGIEVSLPAEEQQKIMDGLLSELSGEMKAGVDIKADGSLTGGFRVATANGKVEHDFSKEAITEALCSLLRPRLAEIVKGSPAPNDD